ncbi:MAG: cation diffusion facilitator family transporter [Lachnospiraceae bacterium]|nr:cation diffusion facilitator family transporter [Lachnospiraceae bacterium]
MVSLLSRLFIKNRDDIKNEKVRTAYGILCGALGIVLNLFLFAFKFVAGTLSGSIAITADAFNNLSDAGSSLITMIGFKLAGQKADSEHPYGHGRVEYISGFLVSVVIIIMAYELIKDSISKIINPEPIEGSTVIFIILGISILIKLYMSFYNHKIGKKINSAAMEATSKDSLSDTIATAVVLISAVLALAFDIQIDGYAGIVVSLFVFWAGFSSAKDTIALLLGKAPEEEFVDEIEKIVMAEEHREKGILGLHDLIVHDYGPGRIMISLHAEVPSDGDTMELHDLIDNIEYDLATQLKCHAVIHMDPIAVNDPLTNELKSIVKDVIQSLNSENVSEKQPKEITFHDFRIVKGPTHNNLIFDIVVPFEYGMKDEDIVAYIRKAVWEKKEYCFCVIHVDKAYSGK